MARSPRPIFWQNVRANTTRPRLKNTTRAKCKGTRTTEKECKRERGIERISNSLLLSLSLSLQLSDHKMTTLGSIAITVAFVVAIYAMLAGFVGARRNIPELAESARNGVILYAVLATIAVISVLYALVTRDFSLTLVANHTSRDLPIFPYTITALWSGQNGSLLFWSWILSLYGLVVMLLRWQSDRELMPYVASVLMLVQTFFAFLLAFVTSPFQKMDTIPADGAGLNPILQHPAMAMHPPMLYLGFVGFTIPFAFAMAALLSGRLNNSWLRATRRWTLIPWMFLGTGLLLGGRWAYDVLGWGGYW